jgi:hypothetical protein
VNLTGFGIQKKGEGIAAQAAHVGPDYGQHGGHGNGGIGGVSTLRQDLGPCCGGQGMTGHDSTSSGVSGGHRRVPRSLIGHFLHGLVVDEGLLRG